MTFGARCDAGELAGELRKGTSKRAPQKGIPAEKKEFGDPFDRIVRLCTVRDRSVAELRERLARDGYDAVATEDALARAVRCGLLDDIRFADALVRARISAGKGEMAIRRDLEHHGIDPEVLHDWPDGYLMDEESQVIRAIELLERNPPKSKDTWSGAFRKLIGKGYSKSVATKAARRWSESPR